MADSKPAVPSASPPAKVPKHRSPNYPSLDLGKSVQKVTLLYAANKRHAVPVSAALTSMEYGAESSTGQQALAALKYFGLVEYEGAGDSRKVKVSERAAKIVGNHSDRENLLREAALSPAIHRELWTKFFTEDGLAPDAAISEYLVYERPEAKFSDEAAGPFIEQFKRTVGVAKLAESATIPTTSAGKAETPPVGGSGADPAKVGDWVQWTSQGMAQFVTPRKVMRIDEREGEKFACVLGDDGKEGWIPMSQVALEAPPQPASGVMNSPLLNPPIVRSAVPAGMMEEVFTVGDRKIIVQFPTVLTADEMQDVTDWLPILSRKLSRFVKRPEETKP